MTPHDANDAAALAGLDMIPVEVEPLGVTMLCDTGRHEVKPGDDCPHCGANPKCAGCPANEEE